VDDQRVTKLAESFGYDKNTGVFVQQIFEDTPSFGKLQEGDIITKIDGKDVKDVNELRGKVAATEPGKEITLSVFRDKKNVDVKLKLGEQPDEAQFARGGGRGAKSNPEENQAETKSTLGMTLSDITDQSRERFGLESSLKGAFVRELDPKGAAAKEGIR